jgi:uncharacterized protein (UPF0333 family)
MLRTKKAQSTLEYIIIFVAIVVAVFMVAYAALRPAVEDMENQAADQISAAAGRFTPNP